MIALWFISVDLAAGQFVEKWSFPAPDVSTPFVFLDSGNTDADPQLELLFGYEPFVTMAAFGRLYLFDGITGQAEWNTGTTYYKILWSDLVSSTGNPRSPGWPTGPQLQDVDGDSRDEIVFVAQDNPPAGQPFVLRVFESDGAAAVPATGDASSIASDVMKSGPNPFNPTSMITFRLQSTARARITVYDPSGREVRTLIDRDLDPGEHTVAWDGCNNGGERVQSGMYFYRLLVDGRPVETEKTILLK
jgi:hypothetical protein